MRSKNPVPADIPCPDEDSARAVADRQNAEKSDSSIFWVERRRKADGQWVAHASRTADDQPFLWAVLKDALNPLYWLPFLSNSLKPVEPGTALDSGRQYIRRARDSDVYEEPDAS
jgi:hypothetical protein